MDTAPPTTAILVLNYHQADATLACIKRLLACEDARVRILWIENDADRSRPTMERTLAASDLRWVFMDPDAHDCPPAGTVGIMRIPSNLGYAGGNNMGARWAHRCGIPYLWILNNDTWLERGCSRDLVAAAQRRPDVGAWGTEVVGPDNVVHVGCRLASQDFIPQLITHEDILESDPLAYIHGCSLFLATATCAQIGFLNEAYFLYYEDPDLSLRIRHAGLGMSANRAVTVRHAESLALGPRSLVTQFYLRRNRWFFIKRYFPQHLPAQRRRLFYCLQRDLFRGRWRGIYTEWVAYRDFCRGLEGRSHRF